MLEQKQALSALLQFASASVEYREISERIVREQTVDKSAAFVWLPLVIGSDVCRRGDTNRQ